ncbi:MAG: hypothetical protein HY318_18880 [Armatimonadetes bacterium]|nr:hypothetical protein [Armatimonadota bacterium]
MASKTYPSVGMYRSLMRCKESYPPPNVTDNSCRNCGKAIQPESVAKTSPDEVIPKYLSSSLL